MRLILRPLLLHFAELIYRSPPRRKFAAQAAAGSFFFCSPALPARALIDTGGRCRLLSLIKRRAKKKMKRGCSAMLMTRLGNRIIALSSERA